MTCFSYFSSLIRQKQTNKKPQKTQQNKTLNTVKYKAPQNLWKSFQYFLGKELWYVDNNLKKNTISILFEY